MVFHYFDFYGRGESIRIALQYFGIEYTEKSIKHRVIHGEEFAEEWDSQRSNYEFASLPVLEIDGLVLSQSRCILRYLFQRQGKYPEEPYGIYRLESLVDLYADIETGLVDSFYSGSDEKLKEYMGGPFVERMGFVNDRLKANFCQDFLCGDTLSMVDVLFCNLRFSFFNHPDPKK